MDCKFPLLVSPKGYVDLRTLVPCGQCIGCRLDRSRQWAIRCVHEAQMHEESAFITLTYSPEWLPFGGTLVKKDFQDFMKRLRKWAAPRKVRFFHCGEYGEERGRPHYHALVFGVDFPDKVYLFESPAGGRVYESAILAKLWGRGVCSTASVTFESAAYVARYALKKRTGDGAEAYYKRVDSSTGELVNLVPEYVTMSLRPGIGREWLRKFWRDVYPAGEVVSRGFKVSSPRYYDKVFEECEPRLHRQMKLRRMARAGLHRGDHTPERLAVQAKVKEAQLKFLKRRLV
jgi:hypothetical protein